jgi:hypothetical protein
MSQGKLAALLITIGIATFILMARDPDLYYLSERIEMVDRNNFDFFPYPIVHDDGITVELIHAKNLNMNEDGAIILTPDQVTNFKKLDPANFKLLKLSDWSGQHIEVDVFDDGRKWIYIRLISNDGMIKHSTSFLFANNELKLRTTVKKYLALHRVISGGCITVPFIVVGMVMIALSIIKSIWPPSKNYSYLKSDIEANQDMKSE